MLLVNFSHPLAAAHIGRIRALTGQEIERVVQARVQFDHERPFGPQVRDLVDSVGLTPEVWQTARILLNPPSLQVIAVTVVAELHGRMGYFPAILRLKPVRSTVPPEFEVAEIINLQAVRDEARHRRWDDG